MPLRDITTPALSGTLSVWWQGPPLASTHSDPHHQGFSHLHHHTVMDQGEGKREHLLQDMYVSCVDGRALSDLFG